jgi:hypothetical protein
MMLEKFRKHWLLTPQEKDEIRAQIVADCDLIGDCWVYRHPNNSGYGMKRIGGHIMTVSRFMLAYESRESLSIKKDACHQSFCPYRSCCNPRHLFWGSHAENCAAREAAKREMSKAEAVSAPVPLGTVTHTEIGCKCKPVVDSSLYQFLSPPEVSTSANLFVSSTI